MTRFSFDPADGRFLGSFEPDVDPMESKLAGKLIYLDYPQSTDQEPPESTDTEAPYWTGTEWTLKTRPEKMSKAERVAAGLDALPEGCVLTDDGTDFRPMTLTESVAAGRMTLIDAANALCAQMSLVDRLNFGIMVGGVRFQADQMAREVWESNRIKSILGDLSIYPVRLRDAANVNHFMQAEEFTAFCDVAFVAVSEIMLNYHDTKDAIRAAANIEDAQALFDTWASSLAE